MRTLVAILLAIVLGLPGAALAAENLDDGIALKGFDAVSFFDGVPRMGRRAITFEHEGSTYRFHSEGNRERFVLEPARYVPAFGGFCAWGVLDDSDHEDVSPGSWKIVDGRLLLFYKGYLGDGLRDWDAYASANGGDTATLAKATIIWNRLRGNPESE
jgi:hypothetical protein